MEKIDDDFVAEVLAADAAPPEAEFDNVADMLEWLNCAVLCSKRTKLRPQEGTVS